MKHEFDSKVEFYITNVCNLTCPNCNRFNNHAFSGWQAWTDYEVMYEEWAQHVYIPAAVILGGEPLLNPTICDWIQGINRTFETNTQILTNGYQLDKVPKLYQAILSRSPIKGEVCHIGISLHNINHFDLLRQKIKNFLQEPIKEWGTGINVESPHGPNWQHFYSAMDSNDVLINMHLDNSFSAAAIRMTPDGRFVLHNTDAELTHNQCAFVRYKCYHFIRGKLYKCGPVALMPEFDQQFNLDISEEDRVLLNSYRPLDPYEFSERGSQFLAEIDKPLAQCKFCNYEEKNQTIFPLIKGTKKN